MLRVAIVIGAAIWLVATAIGLTLLFSPRPGMLLAGVMQMQDFLRFQLFAVPGALLAFAAYLFTPRPRSWPLRLMALVPIVVTGVLAACLVAIWALT